MPLSPAILASSSLLSYMGKTPKSQTRRRDWPAAACAIYARPRNPKLAGESDLKQPHLHRQGPKILMLPVIRASKSLSYMCKTLKSQPHR